MPDLSYRVVAVSAAARGLTPLLHFRLAITNDPADETIHAVILQAQIQIQSSQRSYSPQEKRKLADLFGSPERWGQTLRNKLWAHSTVSVGEFAGSTETILPVPCTYDLNVAATKYFNALDGGNIPLLFLFSGTVFYAAADRHLQVERISWNKECVFQMPVSVWQEMMDQHYPNSAWIYLHRDVFQRLLEYKREQGLPTWEATLERLLPELQSSDAPDHECFACRSDSQFRPLRRLHSLSLPSVDQESHSVYVWARLPRSFQHQPERCGAVHHANRMSGAIKRRARP